MNFKQWLERHPFPITHIAEEIGITPATLHNILRERCEPRLSTAIRICMYSNGQIDLMSLIPPKNRPKVDACARFLES